MKQQFVFTFIAAATIACGCTTLKRYDSVKSPETDNNLADIDLFGYELSVAGAETGIKTLWDLSADAQSQYIKILNARYPDNEKFINAMSFEYLKPYASRLPADYIQRDLRMIFSVSKKLGFGERNSPPGFNLSPADRIEYVRISLKLPDNSGLGFRGWNMFTTDYGSIEIADVSFSRNIEIDASGMLPVGGKVSSGEVSAAGKSSSGRKEDQGIQYRYLRLNGRMKNNGIELEEEGTREIDLTGNIVADVAVEFEKYPVTITEFTGLKDSTGRFSLPEKLTVSKTEIFIPGMVKTRDTIYADLSMDYVFRNVLRGQKTFPEWDDRVKYVRGRVSKSVALLTSEDYVPDLYCIGTDRPPEEREVIKMMDPGNKEIDIIFKTSTEASAFYDWMANFFSLAANKGKEIKIGLSTLRFSGNDLTNDVYSGQPGIKVIPYCK
jgi:hypothetical protein